MPDLQRQKTCQEYTINFRWLKKEKKKKADPLTRILKKHLLYAMPVLPLRREHPTLCQRNWRARITLIRSLHQYYDYRWLLLSLIDNSKMGTFQIGNYDAVLVPLGILQCRRQSFLDRMRGNMSPEFFPPKVSSGTTVRARFLLSTTLPPLWQRRLGPRKYLLMASAM